MWLGDQCSFPSMRCVILCVSCVCGDFLSDKTLTFAHSHIRTMQRFILSSSQFAFAFRRIGSTLILILCFRFFCRIRFVIWITHKWKWNLSFILHRGVAKRWHNTKGTDAFRCSCMLCFSCIKAFVSLSSVLRMPSSRLFSIFNCGNTFGNSLNNHGIKTKTQLIWDYNLRHHFTYLYRGIHVIYLVNNFT